MVRHHRGCDCPAANTLHADGELAIQEPCQLPLQARFS
jgi:hypothetical protein